MQLALIIFTIISVGVALAAFLAWWLPQLLQKNQKQETEKMVQQLYGLASDQLALRNKEILQNEREFIQQDLSHKHVMFQKMVEELRTELHQRQSVLAQADQDRAKQFGELTASLEAQRRLSEEVRTSAQELAKVLSNNQMRGEWGERIIEDLLTANGLIEGTHYRRQAKLGETTARPDISLLLPNERTVPVDVKFPYAEIQKMAMSEEKSQQAQHLKQFGNDLKVKIDKVAKYISPAEKTVDYAILFVPNEMVFSFINQKFPNLVDDAIRQRVLIVSPFTFLVVARTVIESYRNFMIEGKLQQIILQISKFVQEWDKYQQEFAKMGRAFETAASSYDQLRGTRLNQLQKRMAKITEIEKSGVLADQPTLPILSNDD